MKTSSAQPPQPLKPAAVHYRVEAADLHAHVFHVTLTIAQPAAQQCVSLPVWIPGSYLVREFSKNLSCLQARQAGRLFTRRCSAGQMHLANQLHAWQSAGVALRHLCV